jgi:integrase
MSVRKKCGQSAWPCAYQDHRCSHAWIAELMIGGVRRPTVNIDEYALARGATGRVVSRRDAELWEEKIRVDWKQGRDPRRPPPLLTDGSTLLGAMRDYAAFEVPRLRVPEPAWSEMRHVVLFFGGDRPATDLERESVVAPFKTALEAGWRPARRRARKEPAESELREGHGAEQGPLPDGRGVVAVDRILQRLRHFAHWCLHQNPPRMTRSPFHQFGVTIDTSAEEVRSRRLHAGEEAALLAACDLISDEQHWFAGLAMKRRILGARWLGARGSELDRVTSADIDFKTWRVKIRAGKSKKPRTIWLSDESPLRELLLQRRFLKPPHDLAFGDANGDRYNDRSAWETVVLLAHQKITLNGRGRTLGQAAADLQAIGLHFHDIRRECASQWWEQMDPKDIHKLSLWLGHAGWRVTQRYLGLTDDEIGDSGMEKALRRRVADGQETGSDQHSISSINLHAGAKPRI